MKEGIVIHLRVLNNANRLPHSKYPDRNKQSGNVPGGNKTHNLLRVRQMPKPFGHQLPRIYRSVTNRQSWETLRCRNWVPFAQRP